MLPNSHLLSLVPNRVQSAVTRLQALIWTDVTPVRVEATEASHDLCSLAEGKKRKRSVVAPGSAWGKLYDQRWCRVEFPKSAEPLFFNWRDQGEATLYVGGAAHFGFDVGHRHCRLPQGAREGWLDATCVQSGVWHPEATGLSQYGSLFDGASVCHRDEAAWQAYHDMKCLYDIMIDERHHENPLISPVLDLYGQQTPVLKASPFYRRLLRLLDESVDVLDAQGPKALTRKMAEVYAELHRDKTFQRCVLTGHAHIDLVWLWPERIGELKAVHVFSTINRLMSEYPEFKFAYSQPASYEAVARRAPGLYRTVQQRIRRGQWQATGAMYVESDTLIACGEALARSFILGQQGFETITGKPSRLTWLPDVFGYSGSLPQLMQLSGVDWFFTTKMTWNTINRFPYSSFIWRGIDGSEVVAHLSQDIGYVTHMKVDDIKAGLYGHQQADVHNEYLLPTGYGDGGGGPTDEMCERAKRLGSLPGMPAMSWDQPESFFERLAKLRDKLPVYQGECYLEYHRGTYTTHGNVKAAFRGLERALQIHEAAAVASNLGAIPVEAWKRMVFAQFHDYIPGSSVPEVYSEGVPELTRLAKEQIAEAKSALEKKSSAAKAFSVFNPLTIPVQSWVKVPGKRGETLVSIPPLTGAPIEQVEVSEKPAAVSVKSNTVSNGLSTMTINRAGAISSLTLNGKPIVIRGPLGMFSIHPDRAANFESWDIDRHVLSLGELCTAPAKIETLSDGPHRAGFSVTRKIGKQSSATVFYRLEAGSPLIHIEIQLDWQETEHLLKMQFPTGYAAAQARYGIPYGSILRSQIPNGLASEAMWEVPFSRYFAVFDEGERDGLFFVTENKYGAAVRSGDVGLSLVRSPRMTGFEIHRFVRPEALARLKTASRFADIGHHTIRLAIGHYDSAAPREQLPAALADTLFTTPIVYQGKPVQSAYQGLDGGETLIPSWAVPETKQSWVLRLNEVAGRHGSATVRLAKGWKATAVDLLGNPIAKKSVSARGRFDYHPFEIISLRISAM